MFAVPDNTVSLPGQHSDPYPVHVAAAYARQPSRWAHRVRWHTGGRVTELLEDTDTHQVWLMTWLPGQYTDVHDHGGATGAFTVVRGALRERAWRDDQHVDHVLRPGQTRVFGPGYVHEVRGVGAAVSIHVYRPVRSMRTRHA